MNKKVFCEECRDDVDYTIKDKEMSGVIKGINYSYVGRVAYCNDCGHEVYVNEVNDYNLRSLYDIYRKKNGIVSLDIINEIPKKYAIGKRPLSLLLGWGELTFSRYYNGDIPTKQYSDILQRIYDDPRYFDEILESNKDKLKTIAAYKKSKNAVMKLLNGNSEKKIDLVIEYLLHQCEDITPLALQKALYYIQGFYYAFYSSFLFSEDCQAWVHGPVYRDIYFKYRDYRFDPIESNGDFDESVFSSGEKAILDSVIRNVCCYSGKVLEQFTHEERPWLEARGELLDDIISDQIISKESIGDYFKSVKDKYHMINPSDIKEYTSKMFEQI